MSIVDDIKDRLSGDLMARLGHALGEPEAKTRAAAEAAVPAVLSSLANSVLSGKGFDSLLEALHGREGAVPDVPRNDRDVLGSLLGSNLPGLITILSGFTGIRQPAIKTLLDDLGPIILGTIARRLRAQGGIIPANLTGFFTAEKASITGSFPAGLSLVDLPSIPEVPTSVPSPKVGRSGMPSWLIPTLIVAILGIAVYLMMVGPDSEPSPPSRSEAATRGDIPPAPGMEVAQPIPTADQVARKLAEIDGGATRALAEVKDAATAEAAVPKLQALDAQLNVLKSLWDGLPATAKSTVARVARERLDPLKALASRVLEIPGTAERLKPILDALLTKLAGFAV